ncbi:aromatic motif membrane protein [Mycoplasma leachii]|uniref:Putative membrane protein n=1 Tax=Mycoplasma leachii 06049 TaxID=1188244 RepID=A0A2T4IAV4_9MOLU|nr:aromatic motif membrane protein [Mycoplasma leachii]PTD31839.1 putative membrane protein [Mycoplasma leachii 06049]
MSRNKKTLIKISIGFTILPFLILPALFFINNNPKNLNLVIPSGFDVYDNLNNDKETKTKKLLMALIDETFKNSKIEQQEFVKKQQEHKEILASKAKELTSKYLKNQNSENLKEIKDFYSENWLFVFKNLDKFEVKFVDFWKLEANNKKQLHSKEFLKAIDKKEKPKTNYLFSDSNLDLVQTGKENEDLTNLSVIYLKKDKFIIRTLVKNDSKKLEIDKFILFYESPVTRINIDTISDAIHLGVFHNQQDAFISIFEKHIVNEYGYPWDGILLWKEK